MSDAEKELMANKEKELGNEFYKAKEYKKAVRCYTKSIAIFPTPFAYNNRAASRKNFNCIVRCIFLFDTSLVCTLEITSYRHARRIPLSPLPVLNRPVWIRRPTLFRLSTIDPITCHNISLENVEGGPLQGHRQLTALKSVPLSLTFLNVIKTSHRNLFVIYLYEAG